MSFWKPKESPAKVPRPPGTGVPTKYSVRTDSQGVTGPSQISLNHATQLLNSVRLASIARRKPKIENLCRILDSKVTAYATARTD